MIRLNNFFAQPARLVQVKTRYSLLFSKYDIHEGTAFVQDTQKGGYTYISVPQKIQVIKKVINQSDACMNAEIEMGRGRNKDLGTGVGVQLGAGRYFPMQLPVE